MGLFETVNKINSVIVLGGSIFILSSFIYLIFLIVENKGFISWVLIITFGWIIVYFATALYAILFIKVN